MTEFEPRITGIGSDRSANSATATALSLSRYLPKFRGQNVSTTWKFFLCK